VRLIVCVILNILFLFGTGVLIKVGIKKEKERLNIGSKIMSDITLGLPLITFLTNKKYDRNKSSRPE